MTSQEPIRFGYELRSLCSTDGYPYYLRIYTSKETAGASNTQLGSRVVYKMVAVLRKHSNESYHKLFMDNFFSNYYLFKDLKEKNIGATGKVRIGRAGGADRLFNSTKEFNKQDRGYFEHR